METFELKSCIRGYHVFKSIWNPTTREELNCERERTNTEDLYAVAVIRRNTVVGHVPKEISDACALFIITLEYRAVTKDLVTRVCILCVCMCMCVVCIKLTSCLLLRGFKFGTNLNLAMF